MIEITGIPFYVHINKVKKKRVSLTQNWYRNAHFGQKVAVKEEMNKIFFLKIHKENSLEIHNYRAVFNFYYPLTKKKPRRLKGPDANNLQAVIEKFLIDWLQDEGILVNDSPRFEIQTIRNIYPTDKNEGYCDVFIYAVTDKDGKQLT